MVMHNASTNWAIASSNLCNLVLTMDTINLMVPQLYLGANNLLVTTDASRNLAVAL